MGSVKRTDTQIVFVLPCQASRRRLQYLSQQLVVFFDVVQIPPEAPMMSLALLLQSGDRISKKVPTNLPLLNKM